MVARLFGLSLIVRAFAPIAVGVYVVLTLSAFFDDVDAVLDHHTPVIEGHLNNVLTDVQVVDNTMTTLVTRSNTLVTQVGTIAQALYLSSITFPDSFDMATLVPKDAGVDVSLVSVIFDFSLPIPFAVELNGIANGVTTSLAHMVGGFQSIAAVNQQLERIAEETALAWGRYRSMTGDLRALLYPEASKTGGTTGWAERLRVMALITAAVMVFVYMTFVFDSLGRGWAMLRDGRWVSA